MTQAHKVFKAFKVSRANLVQRVTRAIKVTREIPGLLVQTVLMVKPLFVALTTGLLLILLRSNPMSILLSWEVHGNER